MDSDQPGYRWRERHRSGTSGMLIGGLIVAVGLLLLLDNLGIVRVHDAFRFWPVILIVVGVSKILNARTTAGYVWGGMVALAGAFLLLDNLDILIFNYDLIWPMLIIGFGITLLLRALDRRRYLAGTPAVTNPDLGIWAIFSGVKRRIDAQDFKGGEIVAIFGGVHIDLRHAAIAGDRAVIDVNLMFGGVDIRVPDNWRVTMKAVAVFGDFKDRTVLAKSDPNVKTPELVITGFGAFSGTKVDN